MFIKDDTYIEEERSVFFKGVAPGRTMLEEMIPHPRVYRQHKLDLVDD